MTTDFHLDFETRSTCDLSVRGLHNYVTSDTTEVILAAYAEGDHKPKLWEPHRGPMPAELREALEDPCVTVAAWNVAFERLVTQYVLGITKPIEEWLDTMVNARYLSLPGSLEDVGRILEASQQKLEEGSRLVKKFCEPAVEGGKTTLFGISKPAYRDWNTDPEDWDLFCRYVLLDVGSEQANLRKMKRFPLPPQEVRNWWLDQKINERGVPTDMPLVRGADWMAKVELERLTKKLFDLTNLENPNSRDQFLAWIQGEGYTFNSLGKSFVMRALGGECQISDTGREALEIRKLTAKTSIHKYSRIADMVSPDGRLRHQYAFMGAARTGRWSGKGSGEAEDAGGVQLQNLSRPIKAVEKKMDLASDLVRKMDIDGVRKEFGSVLDVVVSVVRAAIKADPGHRLVVSDLNAVENRGLGYLARCDAILNVFRQGRDPYLDFASKLYGIPYEVLYAEWKAGDGTKRTGAKPGTLGCFGADTLVLTRRGWIEISAVVETDLLWDGVQWVRHEGVVPQGVKATLDLFGVQSTPDHEILTGKGWVRACEVMQNGLLARSATDLATGLLSDQCRTATVTPSTHAGANFVEPKKEWIEEIWKRVKRSVASLAPTSGYAKKWAAFTNSLTMSREKSWIASPIGTTPFFRVAGESDTVLIDTRGAGSSVSSAALTSLWRTVSPFPTTTRTGIKSIEKTTTEITHAETSDSFPQRLTIATEKICVGLSGMAARCLRLSFGKSTALVTATKERYPEKSEQGSHQSRSLPTRTSVAVPTFDILNSGPRNRYTILTRVGPLIAHNCGYGLSGGEECFLCDECKHIWPVDDAVRCPECGHEDFDRMWTGLLGYARNMGIILSKEDAERSVKVFRDSYPEVVHFWYDMEAAAIHAIRNPGQPVPVLRREDEERGLKPRISFRCVGKSVLCMDLPSGRALHYVHPRIEESKHVGRTGQEYTKEGITFEGINQKTKQWGTLRTYGSKLVENATQALCRDALAEGLQRAEAVGFEVLGHSHDEPITQVPENSPLGPEDLSACLAEPMPWAGDEFPLGAEGWTGISYRKN